MTDRRVNFFLLSTVHASKMAVGFPGGCGGLLGTTGRPRLPVGLPYWPRGRPSSYDVNNTVTPTWWDGLDEKSTTAVFVGLAVAVGAENIAR